MKITEQELNKRVECAVDNFMQGYGCCQSVVAAFADLYGLDKVMAKRIAAGFGGGIGRMQYYKTRPCAAKVESAARIFARLKSGGYEVFPKNDCIFAAENPTQT